MNGLEIASGKYFNIFLCIIKKETKVLLFANLMQFYYHIGNKLKDVGAYQCSIDRSVCEEALLRMGCTSIRVHIYNVSPH